MTLEWWLGLAGFVMVTSVTPGPNNTLLLTIGLNYGVRRGMPFLQGIVAGFALLTVSAGLGLAALVQTMPGAALALRYGGAAYLLWLASRIATAAPGRMGDSARGLPGFRDGAVLQWFNPKAWLMALTAVGVFAAAPHGPLALPLVMATFVVLGTSCNLVWLGGGTALRRIGEQPQRLQWINRGVGALLALSALAVLLD